MLLQRQNVKPSKPAIPEAVAFVLPGRRTLSENLPAETIKVPVSIAQRSRYLRKLIVQQALNKPKERQIVLYNIDSIGFRFYIKWLRTGYIEFNAAASVASGSGLLLRDCFDLIFAHIVGARFDEPDFQDYIIDTMTQSLDTSQTPDLKVLEVVFLEKGASPVLQRFVIDRMFAVERKMLGMIRGSIDVLGSGTVGCGYHVHEERQCYKTDVRHAQSQSTNMHDSTHVIHGELDVNFEIARVYDGESTPFSLSGSSKKAGTGGFVIFSMTDHPYFGSARCSREVHSLKRRGPSPTLYLDKPLPKTPPLTPEELSTPPSLSSSPTMSSSINFTPAQYLDSAASHHTIEAISTQQLVIECLGRLPPITTTPSVLEDASSKLNTVPIPELVLECLERLNRPSLESTSSCKFSSSQTSLLPSCPA